MPGFIDLIIGAGKTLGGTYKILEILVKMYDSKTYSLRDRIIMEAARKEYKKYFIANDYPLELSYYHEIVGDKEKEGGGDLTSIHDGKVRPPRILGERYVLGALTIGSNDLAVPCHNTVNNIYGYLNELNQKASPRFNQAIYTYGHSSDAIRFLFLLLANGLIELSKINLNDPETQLEAERYVRFLISLQKNENFDNALQGITLVKVGRSAELEKKKPLAIIVDICEKLQGMLAIIVLYRSKSSILEHVTTLNSHVQSVIKKGFSFSVYIMSDAVIRSEDANIQSWFDDHCVLINRDVVSDDYLKKEFHGNNKTAYILSGSTIYYVNRAGEKRSFPVSWDAARGLFPAQNNAAREATKDALIRIRSLTEYTPPYDASLDNLIALRNYLSDIFHFANIGQMVGSVSAEAISSKEDIKKLYNKTKFFLQTNALRDPRTNGVHSGMQAHVTHYIEFCSSLVLLAKLRLILPYLIKVLRAGGDIFAVTKMKSHLIFILKMMECIIGNMHAKQALLRTAADAHFNELNKSLSINDKDRRWKRNQMTLQTSLPPSVCDEAPGVLGPSDHILRIIREWSQNRTAKITELQDAWNMMLSILAEVSFDLSADNPNYLKEFKKLTSGAHRDLFATAPLFDLLAEEPIVFNDLIILEKHSVSITVEEIKTLLTEYAAHHGGTCKIQECA